MQKGKREIFPDGWFVVEHIFLMKAIMSRWYKHNFCFSFFDTFSKLCQCAIGLGLWTGRKLTETRALQERLMNHRLGPRTIRAALIRTAAVLPLDLIAASTNTNDQIVPEAEH